MLSIQVLFSEYYTFKLIIKVLLELQHFQFDILEVQHVTRKTTGMPFEFGGPKVQRDDIHTFPVFCPLGFCPFTNHIMDVILITRRNKPYSKPYSPSMVCT